MSAEFERDNLWKRPLWKTDWLWNILKVYPRGTGYAVVDWTEISQHGIH